MSLAGPPSPLDGENVKTASETSINNVYVVGCYNRHITFNSQQVRAINLVNALFPDPKDARRKRIIVVGAGAAGLTAAVHAAKKKVRVEILEAAARPLWIQDTCTHRWIHPHVYDWPLPGSSDPHTRLPVLNWRAGPANEVCRQIRDGFERAVNEEATLEPPRYGAKVIGVSAESSGKVRVQIEEGDQPEAVDIVLLAVGFGIEPRSSTTCSYWTRTGRVTPLPPNAKVFVSGFGDGGLADLMNLTIQGFRQDQILEVVDSIDKETQRALLERDRLETKEDDLDTFYRKLEIKPVQDWLRSHLSRDSKELEIGGQGSLYSPRSAILNRVIVSQLEQIGAFRTRTGRHRIDPLNPKNHPVDESYCVHFTDEKKEQKYHEVVCRHGPSPALEIFRDIWKESEEKRGHWKSMPQWLDRTRALMDSEASNPGSIGGNDPFSGLEEAESGRHLWCFVLTSRGHLSQKSMRHSAWWAAFVRDVLKDAQEPVKRKTERALYVRPLVVDIEEALSGQSLYERALRAICRAQIMIVDVSGFNPGVMMLLGIRAVVRRGVTLAVTDERLTPELLGHLPFNLREMNLISMAEPKSRMERLRDAVVNGVLHHTFSSRYLDLPPFDQVRDIGNRREAYAQIPWGRRALMLQPFGQEYAENEGEFLWWTLSRLLRARSEGMEDPKVFNVGEDLSPRVVGQRLYEAIRLSELCFVDWTQWRPNVFFELGVRVASNSVDPVCLLSKTSSNADEAHAETKRLLRERFHVGVYSPEEGASSIEAALDRFFEGRAKKSMGLTYTALAKWYDPTQEELTRDIATTLRREIELVAGMSEENVDPLQLFAGPNEGLAVRLRAASLERLVAAVFYLDIMTSPWVSLASRTALLDPVCKAQFAMYRVYVVKLRRQLVNRRLPSWRHIMERVEEMSGKIKALQDWELQLTELSELPKEVEVALFDDRGRLKSLADEDRQIIDEQKHKLDQIKKVVQDLGETGRMLKDSVEAALYDLKRFG